MKMIFVSVPQCAIYKKSFTKFLKNLEKIIRPTGNECSTFVLLYLLFRNLNKNCTLVKFKFAKQDFSFYERLVAQKHQTR